MPKSELCPASAPLKENADSVASLRAELRRVKNAYRDLVTDFQTEKEEAEKCKAEILDSLNRIVYETFLLKNRKIFRLINLFSFLFRSPRAAVDALYGRFFRRKKIGYSIFEPVEAAIWNTGVIARKLDVGCRSTENRSFESFLRKLRERGRKGIWILGALSMGWHEVFKQRHHHIAEILMKNGYLVLCAMNPAYPPDRTRMIRQVEENLFLVNFNDRGNWRKIMRDVVRNTRVPTYYSFNPTEPGTTVPELKFLMSCGIRIFYDYFDELSKEIFPGVTPMHYKRHEFLLRNRDVIVCTTAQNLYRKASVYRSENIILSKNGVSMKDWIVNDSDPVPECMKPVLA